MDIKKISIILSIILAAAAIVGGVMKYDKSIAKADDLRPIQQSIQQLNKRLDRSDLEAMARDIQRRMWLLEDKYGFNQAQGVYEYKCLKRDLEATKKKIMELKK